MGFDKQQVLNKQRVDISEVLFQKHFDFRARFVIRSKGSSKNPKSKWKGGGLFLTSNTCCAFSIPGAFEQPLALPLRVCFAQVLLLPLLIDYTWRRLQIV